jgi:hypothetical protein
MTDESLKQLRAVCPNAEAKVEGGRTFVFLPRLAMPSGRDPAVVDALLCLGEHSGYTTRLFLAEQIKGKGANWTQHTVLGRSWWVCSFNNVPSDLLPIQILDSHLEAFR